MDSNITINIVEPASPTPTPVDPGTGTVVPNTGLFTSGIGGAEAAIIATTILVVILAIIGAIIYYRKHKQGKASNIFAKCKQTLKTKKHASGLAVLALLASIGTVAGLLRLGASAADDNLTLTASSTDFTIEVGDEPVFAVLPVELTVAEATEAGYTLTAYAESTGLVSTTNPSDIIPMVTVEDEPVALADNTYGLALVEPESQEDEVYVALSTDVDTPTLITDKDYKATEAEDKTTIYYGFYITPNVSYGTYTGSSINYQANPNHITNLSFNGNGSDGGTAIEGMTLVAGDTITLPENTFTREGYSFTGWNTEATPTTEDPGIAYADEAEFTASLTQSEDVTLYAQWKKNAPYMQDIAAWGSNLQIGDEITAVDSRDGKEYYVARLADNNIWMTQNLDFNIVNDGADLDSNNTDVPIDWSDAGHLANTYSASVTTWNGSNTAPESYDPGNLYWDGTVDTSFSGTISNRTVSDPSTTFGGVHYHIGNYYNWTAAVAMSDSSSYVTNRQDASQSICPAGWRLPTYSGDKSYQNLATVQGLTTGASGNIQSNPTYFVYGGIWNGSSSNVGTTGEYWSGVAGSGLTASGLEFNAYGSFSVNTGSRHPGYLVRCVAR